jgi:metallo-beta-lactamase family protein
LLTLTTLGAAGTVTGSRHLLDHDNGRLLIDCGLFQGGRELRELNWQRFPVPPHSIDQIVLTHAHVDHSGYIPKLVRDGFSGPIYATPATIDMCRLLLLDSAHLQEKDAEFANRHGFSRHRPALPLYTAEDAERALKQFEPVEFHEPVEFSGVRLLFRRAGHILGAATAEIHASGRSIAFSGDLGRYNDPIMLPPESVPAADFLLIESTYGDRLHGEEDPQAELAAVITRTVRRGGTVVIPAFAVGRTQALLFHLWNLKRSGDLGLVPVYVDSPLATNVTALVAAHRADHKLTPEVCKEAFGLASYVRDVEESKALSASPVPKIIIAGSGMATGGRVIHHIKAFGRNARNTILFAGFQAGGTLGRRLVDGERQVKIHGAWMEIRAEIANLQMLSAHADRDELLRWCGGFGSPPARAFVVHGEPAGSAVLANRLQADLGWRVSVPELGQHFDLERDFESRATG